MYPVRSVGRKFVLFFLAVLVGQASSRPDGAPTAACEDSTPQHAGSPQSSTCPFVIKSSKDEMWSNGTLEVTLDTTTASKFKGFLLMAVDNSSSSPTPIGTFKVDPKDTAQAIDCRDDGTKNALTHTSSNGKTQIVATWTPPEDFDGTVVLKGTFVQSFSKYWVKQLSSPVRVKRTPITSNNVSKEEATTTTTKKPVKVTTEAPSEGSTTESTTTWTTTVPPEIPDSASPISLLAFYSVIIIGITIAFMA